MAIRFRCARALLLRMGLGCLLAALAGPGVAGAATFTVTKTADTLDGSCSAEDCSLREAITTANADPAADLVVLPAGVYALTLDESGGDSAGGDLDIHASMTLAGAGARSTTIQAGGSSRVIDVDTNDSDRVEISGVTLTGGGGVTAGAGIYVSGGRVQDGGMTTLRDAAVVANATNRPGATSSRQGAGVFASGPMTIERVLIAGNTAASVAGDSFSPQGAGLFAGDPVTLVNVTIAGNTLDGTLGGSFGPQGAGLFVNGGPSSLTNVTVAGNTAVDNDSQGAGIFYNDQTTVSRTIVAGNSRAGVPDECFVNDPVTSAAMNLATDAADCGFTAPADVSADPLLAPLADNGGPTDTHAPAAGSPALDRVPFADCPALDQRGFARAGAGAACDLGAHEAGATGPAPPPAPAPPPPPAPAPTPAPAPPPLKATKAFELPPAKHCVSRRRFRIRIRKISGVTFVSATVLVNGRRVRAVKGKRLTAPIDLAGLPKGRFTVKITALAKDGRKVTGTRRYRTCAAKGKARRAPGL